ncbi:hypothetical protein, conserved [Trypanosoma brucei gambiense DAL972]|uniref:Uncharacterized protein n=1 Tax=Trypanosoma brucei gambiense (strain MHOM/CI/86/DAL972) TaxID=679716 RepID=D0A213_TRYB9|nr:hypothetical protein, conserved [Trypanosoma brucei gambiense DAL972]CBH15306.1 hypothetical protein, conserved [Trypanosoma brucei gambiense DAL972]|eukprot:XP_011777571.1 hypothetical protein, conserved [Trypanosoma brucei gambiense DAL972]
MRSLEVQKDSILAAIVMECVKNKPSDTSYHSSVLYQRLSAPETRNLVYQCCLELVDDSQRRRDIGQLLLNYISSFPPSQTTLQAIASKCKPHAASRSPYSSIYQELKVVVETYLNHKPLGYMLGRTLQPEKESITFRQSELSINPGYIQKCNLQPPVTQGTEKGKHVVPFSGWSDDDITSTAREKNKTRSRLWTVKYQVVGCKDYVNQLPLECTETLIEQQVRVLNSFWEKYNTSVEVVRATSFLIKLMCDAYVSKIPLQSNYSFFRAVSICYLPTLFEMMSSTYACVRSHVYDILLTLGMHFQLVDTQGLFPGCTEALEEELIWLLLTVLRKQSMCEGDDEMIWTIAAKCTIVVIPRHKHHLIDCRALYQLMKLPTVITFHPHLYTTFAEAFAKRVLRWDPSGDDAEDMIALDEDEFNKCGNQPVAKLFFLYRQAMTLGARLAFFQVLFTHTVMVLQSRATLPRLYPRMLRRCYSELVRVGFHWHLHSLLFYQSRQVFRELPGHITYDMDVEVVRDYKMEVTAIVQCMLQTVEDNVRLPDVIRSAFRNAVGTRVEERTALARVVSECVTLIPAMLKEDTDGVLYNIGWHTALYCMRLSREKLDSDESVALLDKLATNLVSFSEFKDRTELTKIKGACPDILAALMFLGRKHPNQAVEPFSILIEKFLHDTAVVDSQSVMQLYYRLFGSLAIQNGPFKGAQRADISQMLCSEQLVTAQPIIDGIGSRVLWALYRSLCTVQTASACRARHVLASFLEELDTSGGSSHSYSWKTIMDDPYPPVALIGAQRTLQMCGRTAYDRFDEAMNTPEKSEKCDSVYVLALKVIQLAESRKE